MTVAELHPRFTDSQIRDWKERNGMTDPLDHAEQARTWFVIEALIWKVLADVGEWVL